MNNVAIRIYAVIGIIVVVYGIGYLVKAAVEPPEVEMPKWTINDLPVDLGKWHGEETELDPEIAAATGAYVITNRIYRDDVGRGVSVHSAMFSNPADGVYHSPLNCYRSNGWKRLSETKQDMKVSEDLTIPVVLTTWEKDREKIIVAFWYQLGQHVLHSRLDLGGLRWEMRGSPTWPVLIKVMLQSPLVDADDAETTVFNFGQEFSKWLNSPEHRQYLDQWGGI